MSPLFMSLVVVLHRGANISSFVDHVAYVDHVDHSDHVDHVNQ